MSAASNAIRVAGVVKTFGNARALDGLDLSVDTGEVHGFLGPNGSGKSTTIRILLGQMRADSGSALVLGATPGATRSGCTAAWPTCQGTSTCGRTSPAAR